MTDVRFMVEDPRVAQALLELRDAIEARLAEQGVTLTLMAVCLLQSDKNSVLLNGCTCDECLTELLEMVRKVANGRKSEARTEMPGKAVH